MSFLSLAFLFALPLAAAPILLHFFDRQRNVVIEWGAMQFLVEAAKRRTSARRLQQWLLLLLRTLAIVCLVMALARPLMNSNWLGTVDRLDTVLVIDNSLSMTRTNVGTSLFETARQKAIECLDSVPASGSIRILLTSPYPIWMTPSSVRISNDARLTIRERLVELQPTQGGGDLLAALFNAVQSDLVPGTKRRRIEVITDGQASDWKISDEREWHRLRDLLQQPLVPTVFEVVSLDSKQTPGANLAINKIHSNRTVVGPQQMVSLAAQVQNHGSVPSNGCSMKWSIAGEIQHQNEIPELQPGAIHEVIWKQMFSSLGVYAITGQIDADDILISDNHESVIVEVVDRIPVLVVEGAAGTAEVVQDAFFLQAALGWIDGEPLGVQGVHVPTLVTPEQFERTDLHEFRAVVIPNFSETTETIRQKLQSFVNDGGGIWIALGPRTDVERFNQFFFADGDGLSPLAIDRIVDDSDSKGQKTTIDPFVGTHPATASLADNERLDTSKIAVSRRFRFAPASNAEDVSVLLSLTNGDPFAVEKVVGQGRVIVQAAPLKLQWSELVRSQAFVVMVQDWLNYLTQPQATRHNLAPGEPIRLHITNTDVHEATLRTPQAEDIELTAESTNHGTVFRTSRTIQPGDYSLEVGLSGDAIPFHVHRDPQESNLTPLTTAEHQMLMHVSQLGRITNGDSPSAGSAPSDPVWPFLLILLAGLMLAELMLAGNMSRRRFGADPIAETTERLAENEFGSSNLLTPNPRSMPNRQNDRTPSRT